MADPFRIQATPAPGAQAPATPKAGSSKAAGGPSFGDTLAKAQDVKFSNHALNRLESRDIQLSPENVNRLSNAIDKAEKRGGKSSLVMVDNLAFIVNVQNRTVVTAMDADQRGEGVFTQIDSVVFADPSAQASKSLVDKQG